MTTEKRVHWLGSSKRDYLAFPETVLHPFQKKSPSGIRTSRVDVDLVSARLKLARLDFEENR